MALLDVKDIHKVFGGLVAVDHVTLQVDKGEIVSIIGPNGAGKTTVFNMVTGICPADMGSVMFAGQDITNLKPREIVAKGISRTFQNIRLFSNLRVWQNVLIGEHLSMDYGFGDLLFRTGKYKSVESREKKRAMEILAETGLAEFYDSFAGDLPYGSQRRLEIARAIATNAKLLLLDEPAAGMNPQESEDLMEFVLKLRQKGFTILMIEHDMNIVMNISDRIYVMNYGKLIASGAPKEVATNPEVVKAYLGESED